MELSLASGAALKKGKAERGVTVPRTASGVQDEKSLAVRVRQVREFGKMDS